MNYEDAKGKFLGIEDFSELDEKNKKIIINFAKNLEDLKLL